MEIKTRTTISIPNWVFVRSGFARWGSKSSLNDPIFTAITDPRLLSILEHLYQEHLKEKE